MTLDPATNAIRSDLADIRLAGRVFASHFAAAIVHRATRPAAVAGTRDNTNDTTRTVTHLKTGDRFDVLELTDDLAWGVAPGPGLVGYVERDALEVQA